MTITIAGRSLLTAGITPTPQEVPADPAPRTAAASASGARDLWQLVDEVSVLELGGAANGARGHDLSALASKYLGETEKSLGGAFGPVEHRAASLLFDEADALFGNRTDVPMPEQLHPGVYLTEVPFEARPIEGVPTSPVDATARGRSGRGVAGGLAVDAGPPGGSVPTTVSPGLAIGTDGRSLHPLSTAAMRRFGAT